VTEPLKTACLLLLLSACGSTDGAREPDASADAGPSDADAPDAVSPCPHCALREAAALGGIRIGVAAGPRDEPGWNELLVGEFDALSPEGELLWNVIHPEPERWELEAADRVLAFASDNGMFTTVSHFVWDQATEVSGTPDWVRAIDDPDELRAAMRTHLRTITDRYGSLIGRWIVVNEPLSYPDTGHLQPNHFHQTLGDHYVAEAFQMAAEEAPDAERWLNEIFTEFDPVKCDALVALATDLVERDVPIDGVGIQGHLFPGVPDFALVEATMRRLAALGLKVAVTELDAPVDADAPDRLALQADRMAAMVRVCLAVPGATR
jgi:endo-1,4-beta-xylanase